MPDLSNKVALVTGSSRAIGAAIAKQVAIVTDQAAWITGVILDVAGGAVLV